MTKCFSVTHTLNRICRTSFATAGLKSTTTDLKDGTIIHCWVPKTRKENKPDLLLIHGYGPNAMWQWYGVIRPLTRRFNVYVPDLLFFGESFTTRSERTESFQAQCLMRVMEANSVKKLSLVGLSYGGFVGCSMAAQFKEAVDRVVICSSGVCLEEKDLADGMFLVSDVEEGAEILVPKTPEKLKELVNHTFFRPPPLWLLPSCFLADFINVMCTEYAEEKKDLLRTISRGRKLSDCPQINQPTLIVWGDQDKIFQLSLAHRLKSHLGENAELIVMNKAGHVLYMERPKEFVKHLKSFLIPLKLQNGK